MLIAFGTNLQNVCTFFVGVGGYEEAWLSSLKSLPSYSGYTSSSSPDEQVWSLTILLTFQNHGSARESVFTNTRFASVGFDGVLGPPCLLKHT